jgi:Mn-dependent DtxR family transcriptional regulator
MGQQEVYEFLKKNKRKWFTSKEIAKGLNVSLGSVTNNLKKLRSSKEILYKESSKRKNMYWYKFKG